MRAICASVVLAAGLAASASTAGQEFPVAKPGRRVETVLATPPGPIAPGCVAGVFDGAGTRTYAAGVADLATRRPLGPDTQFYVASISKQFTALAIARLALAGRLSLNDDVRRWIPEMPRYGAPVTIAMLLHHTGGIRDPIALLRLSGYADIAAMDRNAAVALVAGQSGTDFMPGTHYEYSNGGYLLLSEVVSRASMMGFAQYVRRTILAPLGMTRSFVLDGARPTGADVARGYGLEAGGYVLHDTYPLYGGAGGLITTIDDIGRYHRDVAAGHKVWTADVAAMLETPGTLTDGKPVEMTEVDAVYAGGLMLHGRWIEHGGDSDGFKAEYARLRDRPFGIAVFCNRGDVVSVDKADETLRLLASDVPPLRSPARPLRWANGRFSSPDLPALYRVTTVNGRMTIVRSPTRPGVTASAPITLKRAIDGAFVSDDGRMRVVEGDDGDGFTIYNWRAAGIRFRRLPG